MEAHLCRANPCSEMGKAKSQLEAPLSDPYSATWWIDFASNILLPYSAYILQLFNFANFV